MVDLWQPPRGRGGSSRLARLSATQSEREGTLRLAGGVLAFLGATSALGALAGAVVAVLYIAGEGWVRHRRTRRAPEVFREVGEE